MLSLTHSTFRQMGGSVETYIIDAKQLPDTSPWSDIGVVVNLFGHLGAKRKSNFKENDLDETMQRIALGTSQKHLCFGKLF